MAAFPTLLEDKSDLVTIALTWIGVALSVVGGILQELDSRPYVLNFEPSDWLANDAGFHIDIPQGIHRRGAASITEIYMLEESGRYAVCGCDIKHNLAGDCRVLISARPFVGRVVIK